jgi:hypothetical protein
LNKVICIELAEGNKPIIGMYKLIPNQRDVGSHPKAFQQRTPQKISRMLQIEKESARVSKQ